MDVWKKIDWVVYQTKKATSLVRQCQKVKKERENKLYLLNM